MKFEVEGYNLQELVKVLYRKKIKLTDVSISNNTLAFNVDDSVAKKVKKHILNHKIKTIPSYCKRLPKFILTNLGVLLGVFFGSVFAIFASAFTWQIKVYGTEQLVPENIIEVLAQNGIKKGKINTITSEEIETILLNNYNRIAQVSVIKQGSAIIINLSEKLVYSNTEYQPITAKFNGIITQIKLTTGTINVKVGDYVNKGDSLVLPFNINSQGQKVFVKPMAEICAKIYVIGNASVSEVEQTLSRTGNTQVEYNYSIFNKRIFSGKNKNSFDLYETELYNEYIFSLVPLKRQKVVYYQLAQCEVRHDISKEKENTVNASRNIALNNLPTTYTLIEEQTNTTVLNNTLYATTTIVVNGIIT